MVYIFISCMHMQYTQGSLTVSQPAVPREYAGYIKSKNNHTKYAVANEDRCNSFPIFYTSLYKRTFIN